MPLIHTCPKTYGSGQHDLVPGGNIVETLLDGVVTRVVKDVLGTDGSNRRLFGNQSGGGKGSGKNCLVIIDNLGDESLFQCLLRVEAIISYND